MATKITVPPPPSQIIEVFHCADVAAARHAAKQFAEAVGVDSRGCEEVALAVSELASNLVKHAGGGRLFLTPVSIPPRLGLQIESIDNGPGIPNINEAMADGYSTAGSLGAGLGAVNRLMDEFNIKRLNGQGTHIVCRKWVRIHIPSLMACPFEIGVASRPKPGFDQNGDDFVVKHWAGNTLVGVIDGLGHGEPAHVAAVAARNFVESHCDQPLDALFRGTAFACQGTRGCVMALAQFDWERGKITFASVGNIEARVIGGSIPVSFMLRRGIVGLNTPAAHVGVYTWEPENMLVLYSDGVTTHWNWRDFPQLAGKPASVVAQGMLRALAKLTDDATILIVKTTAR